MLKPDMEGVALVVMTSAQLEAMKNLAGVIVADESVTRNALWGIPFEVNDHWMGGIGLLTEDEVVKYRQARRSLELRMNPARRLTL